tara:strand:+ start:380 stop:820 length:441 start_codon:yes stop_codon:yes gene_type:complete
MSLKDIVNGLLGSLTIVPQCGYTRVSVDALSNKELLELKIWPKRKIYRDGTYKILFWHYQATNQKGVFNGFGFESIPKLVEGLKSHLSVVKPFSELLLHVYHLNDLHRMKVSRLMGIPKVAYLTAPPIISEKAPTSNVEPYLCAKD